MQIETLLTDLAACLCAQITDQGLPEPCWCGVYPGSSVVADFFPGCDEDEGRDGMAWVRLASAYPAFAPGVVVEDPAQTLYAGLGYDIEVGILRSVPIPQEGLDEPLAALSVTGQMDDMACIRKAILCCSSFERGDYILGQYTPVGPLGGVVGGAFTLMVHKP